ncbi:MAG TPA: hypothetical protein PKC28_14360 [Bdellovibrionales bacterium]|nr:hypothetical protein [Bdellovibrionales bacterium]
MIPTRNLKSLLALQGLVTLVLTGIAVAGWGVQLGASFGAGAVLMWANIALLGWSSWRTLMKKSIAWTSLIIVIKYTLLLGSIVVLSRVSGFSSLAAGLGIACFLVTALALAVFYSKKETV